MYINSHIQSEIHKFINQEYIKKLLQNNDIDETLHEAPTKLRPYLMFAMNECEIELPQAIVECLDLIEYVSTMKLDEAVGKSNNKVFYSYDTQLAHRLKQLCFANSVKLRKEQFAHVYRSVDSADPIQIYYDDLEYVTCCIFDDCEVDIEFVGPLTNISEARVLLKNIIIHIMKFMY